MLNGGSKKMIDHFSNDVIEQMGYYVYRLIDPRNGQTFYVGKGTGNRVFDHVKCAIKHFDTAEETSDDDPLKYQIIKQILDENLEVIHIIQRWNLTEKEAFEVESALIDCYQGLSNIQSGHHSEYGVTNAEQLQNRLSCSIYDEPDDFKYYIIKIKQKTIDERNTEGAYDGRYEATRKYWKIRPKDIKTIPYAFSVTDGIVREVYRILRWEETDHNNRYAFIGQKAEEDIRKKYVNTRIPDYYCKKGMASPVLISKNHIK